MPTVSAELKLDQSNRAMATSNTGRGIEAGTKNVVVIAYNFPPDGSAGVHRPLRFVQHLPALNWKPTVVSLAASHFERYDPGLLALVPKDTEVVRVPQRDPWHSIQARRAQKLRRKMDNEPQGLSSRLGASHEVPFRSRIREIVRSAEAWCYHPDLAMGWIRPAVRATLKICDRKEPNAIYATGGPWSSFIVAQRVSRRTGVPYVLDFRDSWTLAYTDFEAKRPLWALRLDRRLLHKLLQRAQAIVFRYKSEAECYWRTYQGALDASKIHIIPNGYSGEMDNFVAPHGDKCTILYAGTLTPYRYDTLLQGLQQLKKSDPGRAAQLRFIFVGEGMEALAEEAVATGISDIIETRAPVSYKEVARLQRNAHALLLLGVKPTRGYELCGSKVFSYLKANRPIIGIVSPADEVRKVLLRVGVSTATDPDATGEIGAVLQRLLEAWSTGKLRSLLPDPSACAIYSAERQTSDLVHALEGLPAAEAFIPGAAEIPPSLLHAISNGK